MTSWIQIRRPRYVRKRRRVRISEKWPSRRPGAVLRNNYVHRHHTSRCHRLKAIFVVQSRQYRVVFHFSADIFRRDPGGT
jgi:hypothetical protein